MLHTLFRLPAVCMPLAFYVTFFNLQQDLVSIGLFLISISAFSFSLLDSMRPYAKKETNSVPDIEINTLRM